MIDRLSAASYPSDRALLDELRATWPPAAAASQPDRGYVSSDDEIAEPAAALRLGDRFAVALIARPGGSFLVMPLARDEVVVTSWRSAGPGDGLSAFVAGVPVASERAIATDQTNASTVVGERAILKWFRRIGPGPSRAATMLEHLDAVGFAGIPTPLGSLAWRSPAGADLTIAEADAFLPGARDGWDWCVERVARHVGHADGECPAGCDPWLGRQLGELVASLHRALAMPSTLIPVPALAAPASEVGDWRRRAGETLDEAIALTLADDPESGAVLAGLERGLRAALDRLGGDRSVPTQPVHGDLHVGQVLEWPGGLAVIDFDGNPALGDEANALRQPIERDLAQMTMSLDHVGRIVDERTAGVPRDAIEAWIARTRREFLAAATTRPIDAAVLAAFEIEQECRELVYAARFLPRWRYAPMAALRARFVS